MSTLVQGIHVAKIIGQRIERHGRTDTPYAAIHVELLGSIDASNPTAPPVPCEAVRRTVECWITPAAVGHTTRTLRQLGWSRTKFAEFDERNPDHQSLRGQHVYVDVLQEADQRGAMRERLRICTRPRSYDEARVDEIDRLFGDALRDGGGAEPARDILDPPDETTDTTVDPIR
ncbi:hypothetical protein GC173_16555 [bacterium]|nr:hypothetical protein [bacterium]